MVDVSDDDWLEGELYATECDKIGVSSLGDQQYKKGGYVLALVIIISAFAKQSQMRSM